MNNIQEIKTKFCKKCNTEKDLSEFNTNRSHCKICLKNYRQINKARISKYQRRYRDENKVEISEKQKIYQTKNKKTIVEKRQLKYHENKKPKKIKPMQYTKKCIECGMEKPVSGFYKRNNGYYGSLCKPCELLRSSRYKMNHKLRLADLKNKRDKIRRMNDINYHIRRNLSSRMLKVVKSQNATKSKSSLILLGCSIEEFRFHIESQFMKGMEWSNHGYYGWHIDHIKPCSAFDLTDPAQQAACFHYSNMQPLWWRDNFRKSNSY